MPKKAAALSTQPPTRPFGYRIRTWCEMTGLSKPTIYRQIKDGRLKMIKPNDIPTIPHAEAVRLGYVTE